MCIRDRAHVAFLVSDREASLRFYRDALGLTPQFEMEDEEGRPWIQYLKIADRQFLELFCPHPGEAPGDVYKRQQLVQSPPGKAGGNPKA